MTFNYKNVYLDETSTIAGIYEAEGPLKDYYDKCYKDFYLNLLQIKINKNTHSSKEIKKKK